MGKNAFVKFDSFSISCLFKQKHGCMAVRNLVARTREYCEPLLEFGAEEIIHQARKVKNCEDEAKAALRDLGCQVDLKERWTGEKGSLH